MKNTNIWKLNNTLLNNEQITEEIKICIAMNENENTTIQNLWDSVKAAKISKIRNENGEITTDNTKIQRLIKDY